MRNFLNKKGYWIIIAAVIVALIAAVSVALGNSGSDAANALTGTLLKPIRTGMSSFVDTLEKYYNYMHEYDSIVEENRQLKDRVSQLESEYLEYTAVSEENDRLRELLNLQKRHSDYQLETATIISWTSSNYASSFTINKGTSSGLELYQGIITESGYLVGQITAIDYASATVTTILDTTSNVGALVNETSEVAIVNGDFDLFREQKVALSYLQTDSSVIAGDTIITSGKGGVYPQGLVIGYVDSVSADPSGLNVKATVTPAADINNLTHIFVITGFEVSQ